MKDFLVANWGALSPFALALAWGVVRLTPTKWDDKILKVIVKIIEFIPDNKKGGGKHVK